MPPLVAQPTDIVVSPLISFIKCQVDALAVCGYPSAALYSTVDDRERRVSPPSGKFAGLTPGSVQPSAWPLLMAHTPDCLGWISLEPFASMERITCKGFQQTTEATGDQCINLCANVALITDNRPM